MTVGPVSGIMPIPTALGVSPVGSDTHLLAELGNELAPTTALDMGTGSGYIAVALALTGVVCTATDISEFALANAQELAQRNRCEVRFVNSDLFSHVSGKYDLVLFNPPFGHSQSVKMSRWLDVIKSMIPKEHPVVRRVVFELVRPARARMLERFLQQVLDHLQPGGSVLLFIHRREVTLTTGWRREVVATDREFRVVRLWPTTTHSQASF